jgi:hypothetical protein
MGMLVIAAYRLRAIRFRNRRKRRRGRQHHRRHQHGGHTMQIIPENLPERICIEIMRHVITPFERRPLLADPVFFLCGQLCGYSMKNRKNGVNGVFCRW